MIPGATNRTPGRRARGTTSGSPPASHQSPHLSEAARRIIASAAASALCQYGANTDRPDDCALILIKTGYPAAIVASVLDDAMAGAGRLNRRIKKYD